MPKFNLNFLLLFAIAIFALFLFTEYKDHNRYAEPSPEAVKLRKLVEDLQKKIQKSEQQCSDLLDQANNLNQKPLRNPTWEELQFFLKLDKTNEKKYQSNIFDCSGFALKLRDRAIQNGFRAAIVEIAFATKDSAGHALNAFMTTDQGLVYIDSTGSEDENKQYPDRVAYVEIGKIYGTIPVTNAEIKYIDTSGKPNEFYQKKPEMKEWSGSIFSYQYYEAYLRRHQFLKDSKEFMYLEINRYNKEIADYNAGARRYSHNELSEWLENRIVPWRNNLDLLQAEFSLYFEHDATKIVSHIETYWPDAEENRH